MSKKPPSPELTYEQRFQNKWLALETLDKKDAGDKTSQAQRADLQRSLTIMNFEESIKMFVN